MGAKIASTLKTACRIAEYRTEFGVVKAVVVDVRRGGRRPAEIILHIPPMNHKAARARSDCSEVEASASKAAVAASRCISPLSTA